MQHRTILRSKNVTPLAILAIPFLFVIFFTQGLTVPLPTFHGGDEINFHYPAIVKFADEFPYFDLTDYSSATTPYFHIVFATIGKIIGLELPRLRFVNVLFSYAAIVLLYFILLRHFRLATKWALLLALLFELSPYYFGVSFLLLTDNLALLLQLGFFYFYFRYEKNLGIGTFLLCNLLLVLTVLTRQTFLFLSLALLAQIVFSRAPGLHKIKLLCIAALPAAAFFVFVLLWNGLTPPSFKEAHVLSSIFNWRSFSFGIAVLGFYSLFFLDPGLFRTVAKHKILTGGMILLSSCLFIVLPLAHTAYDDGFLWRISRYFPQLGGSSVLFFILVPLGLISLIVTWRKTGFSFQVLALLAFFLVNIFNRMAYQKYYDYGILLFLIFMLATFRPLREEVYSRLTLLLVLFVLYTIAYQALTLTGTIW